MKKIAVFLAVLFPIFCPAQIFPSPFPMKGSDFEVIKQEKITVETVYRILDGDAENKDSTPVYAVEYGNMGLPAVLYTIGISEEDWETLDTTAITYYKFDSELRQWTETTVDAEYGESNTLYTYNKKGQLVKKETATIDPPTYNYKYDKKGALKEIYVTQKMPVYDQNGDFNGKTFEWPASRYLAETDANGRLTSLAFYFLQGTDGPGELYSLKKWEYDGNGRVTRIRQFGSDGITPDWEKSIFYDQNGLVSGYEEKSEDWITQYTIAYCRDCVQSWMRE